MARFVDLILDEFDNFLSDRNIIVPNFEKVDFDNPTPIFGKDREQMKKEVEKFLNKNLSFYSANDFENVIIEILETFLDENGIVIPNKEKTDAIEDGAEVDEIANIYGSDYGDLQSAIEFIISEYECEDLKECHLELFKDYDSDIER